MPTKAQLIAKHEQDMINMRRHLNKRDDTIEGLVEQNRSLKADHKELLDRAVIQQDSFEHRIARRDEELEKTKIQRETLMNVIKTIAK